jgi:hypothetical protein
MKTSKPEIAGRKRRRLAAGTGTVSSELKIVLVLTG